MRTQIAKAFLAFLAVLFVSSPALAASSPPLGQANSFVILSDTYSNSASGTTLTGDLGYTTPPATTPTVNGATHVADSTYSQAGIDQGSALSQLNSQPCTFDFPLGAVDLATETTHGSVGVYTPGVYCITGAASIGDNGTVTLNGAGTYIFRMDGALNTGANSVVQVVNGAVACNVWWTPIQETTLGADSTFAGTDIDAAGITIGANVNWEGKALSFGGTVSTDTDTVSTSVCSATTTTNTTNSTNNTSDTTSNALKNPGLPNAGLGPRQTGNNWIVITPILLTVLSSLLLFLRKKA